MLRDIIKRDDPCLTEPAGSRKGEKPGDNVADKVKEGLHRKDEGKTVDDVRTLRVSYDSQGSRWKLFRDAVVVLIEDPFPDFPIEDPRSVL